MIRRVHFASLDPFALSSATTTTKKERRTKEKKGRTNASEPRQSHVRWHRRRRLLLVSGQRLSNTLRDKGCSFFVMILEAALFRRDQRRESRPTRDAFCTASSIPHKIDLFFTKFSLLSLSLSLSLERDKKKENFVWRRPKIKTKMSCPRDGVFRCGVFFLLFFLFDDTKHQQNNNKERPNFFCCVRIEYKKVG